MPELLNAEALPLCSKHELSRARQRLLRELKRRYWKSRRATKRGNMQKSFTDDELSVFLRSVMNPKVRFAFQLMAGLGLRVGEVCLLRLDAVHLDKACVYVQTEKAMTGDRVYLHPAIFPIVQTWIQVHRAEITASGGWLLTGRYGKGHMSPDWLRNEFRKTLLRLNMGEVYCMSDETDRPTRKLYRLSTHSFRHYFVTKVYNTTRDLRLAQRLARHRDISTTQIYITKTQEELDACLRQAFQEEITVFA